MKARILRWLPPTLGLAAALAAFGWWGFSKHEPKYEGKPVSYWFKEYRRPSERDSSKEAMAALQAIGTNAVPYLLEQAFNTNEDSILFRYLNRLPRSWNLPRDDAYERCRYAAQAFELIKPPAHQLLSLLQRRLKSTNVFDRNQSLFILGKVGDGAEEVVPELEAALIVTNRGTCAVAIQSLGWIGPRAGAAVPALIKFMNNPLDPALGFQCASALGGIGSNAATALPLVRETHFWTENELEQAMHPDRSPTPH